jgi:hypothetical protein
MCVALWHHALHRGAQAGNNIPPDRQVRTPTDTDTPIHTCCARLVWHVCCVIQRPYVVNVLLWHHALHRGAQAGHNLPLDRQVRTPIQISLFTLAVLH